MRYYAGPSIINTSFGVCNGVLVFCTMPVVITSVIYPSARIVFIAVTAGEKACCFSNAK